MVKKIKEQVKRYSNLERLSYSLTNWVGTPGSILVHTLLFIGCFSLSFLGFSLDQILLILTTAVSLEAIYLAIFIQMTVNRNTKSLEEVEADIDEIQEDVEDLEEDVEEIQADDDQDDIEYANTKIALEGIEKNLRQLLEDIDHMKKTNLENHQKSAHP